MPILLISNANLQVAAANALHNNIDFAKL